MNKFEKIVGDILKEAEPEVTTKEADIKRAPAITEENFDTELGKELLKVAKECKELIKTSKVLTYDDMKVFWENINERNSTKTS